MGLDARKPVFGVSEKASFKPVPQLQRPARRLKFTCSMFTFDTFQNANNKGADQTALMRRLVCDCVDHKPPNTGFLATRPKSYLLAHTTVSMR